MEVAQSACQSDHDLRAMASVNVGPFEWVGVLDKDQAMVGKLSMHVRMAWDGSNQWFWNVQLGDSMTLGYGLKESRAEAITAAEQFVTRLVMGERE
jgi:hypothetical protein